MSETIQDQAVDFIDLAGQVVSAYVSNNSVRPADLPDLIATVYTALRNIADGTSGSGAGVQVDEVEKPTAAQIKKSIRPNGLVSFIDGKTYQTLKRHLNGHGLHPHSYRERFGLPSDYPMTAPDYSARRSALARSIGLGRPGRTTA
ncbi:MucR family transcriptional regulator [Methylobacterium sp. WL122]|nr:MucR family transcriptional regulator [Methylobacterium sp. WL122]